MRRKLLGGVVIVVSLAALALLVLFAGSEFILRTNYEAQGHDLAVPSDAATLAEGRRLALTRGCYDGCHGPGGEGQDFFDGLPAPNLTQILQDYSVTDIERAVRQGVRPDGKPLVAMPSDTFQYLNDRDLGAIIAFFRSLPRNDNNPGPRGFPLLVRFALLFDLFDTAPVIIEQAEKYEIGDHSDPVQKGKYLAFSTCVECHGGDLRGVDVMDFTTPSLAVAGAYAEEDFRRLMTTGEGLPGSELDLMAAMGRNRFSHFTEDEVSALYAYFTSDEFTEHAFAEEAGTD